MAKAIAAAIHPRGAAGRRRSAAAVAPPIRIGICGWMEAWPSQARPARIARTKLPRWIALNVRPMPAAAKTPDHAKCGSASTE